MVATIAVIANVVYLLFIIQEGMIYYSLNCFTTAANNAVEIPDVLKL